jgi:hypothetical protein
LQEAKRMISERNIGNRRANCERCDRNHSSSSRPFRGPYVLTTFIP